MSGSNLARCWPLNGPGSLERQGTRESPLRAFPRQPPGGAISTEQFWGCPSWSEEKSQGRRLSRLTATPRDLQQLASWVVLVSSSDKAIQRAPQGACCRDHELAASPLHAEVSHWCGGATQGSLGFTALMRKVETQQVWPSTSFLLLFSPCPLSPYLSGHKTDTGLQDLRSSP